MISHADYPSEKDTVPMLISFVVPCYNEEESLPLFYDEACRVANVLRQQSHAEAEFIFVDVVLAIKLSKSFEHCMRKMNESITFLSPEISAKKLLYMRD